MTATNTQRPEDTAACQGCAALRAFGIYTAAEIEDAHTVCRGYREPIRLPARSIGHEVAEDPHPDARLSGTFPTGR